MIQQDGAAANLVLYQAGRSGSDSETCAWQTAYRADFDGLRL